LAFRLNGCNWLRRKLEHRCFLTQQQVSQQYLLPVGKFQEIMMNSVVVLIGLPKGGRRVIDHYHVPSEQTARAAPYCGCEGKLRSRKNANRRTGIFRRSKSDRSGVELLGSQFLARLRRTGLNILRHAGALLCSTQRNRPTEELRDKAFGSRLVGLGSLEYYSHAVNAQQYIPALQDSRSAGLRWVASKLSMFLKVLSLKEPVHTTPESH